MRLDLFHRCLAIPATTHLLAAGALYILPIDAVPADSAGNSSQSHERPSICGFLYPLSNRAIMWRRGNLNPAAPNRSLLAA
jgi:hypothetical protein